MFYFDFSFVYHTYVASSFSLVLIVSFKPCSLLLLDGFASMRPRIVY